MSYSLFLSVCTKTNLTLGTTFGGQANALKELMFSVSLGSTLGDVNFDGLVNVLDVVLLVNSVLNGGSANDYPQADVNGDGTLNVLDVVLLINIILEI